MGELLRLRCAHGISSAWRTTKSGAFVFREQNCPAHPYHFPVSGPFMLGRGNTYIQD